MDEGPGDIVQRGEIIAGLIPADIDIVGGIGDAAVRGFDAFHGIRLLVEEELLFLAVFTGTLAGSVVVHHGIGTTVHVTALLPVEGGGNVHLVDIEVRRESEREIRGDAADHPFLADLRKTVFVDDGMAVGVTQVVRTVDHRELVADAGTDLRLDETAQVDAFHTLGQFVDVVVHLGEVEGEVPVDVLGAHGVHAQADFMGVGVHGTGVGHEAAEAGGAGQRNGEDLVLHVLAGEGVVQGDESLPEGQFGTDFPGTGVLGNQVLVVPGRAGRIGDHTVDRIADRGSAVETAAVDRRLVERLVELSGHTHFRIGAADLAEGQHIVLQGLEFGEDEAQGNGRIEETAVAVRHGGNLVVTAGEVQEQHILVIHGQVGEVTERAVCRPGDGGAVVGCVVQVVPAAEVEVLSPGVDEGGLSVYDFITIKEVHVQFRGDLPVDAGREQGVELADGHAHFVNFSLAVAAAEAEEVGIGRRVDVLADLVFGVKFQRVGERIGEGQVGVSEEALVVLPEGVVFQGPVRVRETGGGAEGILLVRVLFQMAGNALHVIVGRSADEHGVDTVVGSGLLLHGGLHEVRADARGEILAQAGRGVELGVVTIHAGSGDDTRLMGIAEAEGIIAAAHVLGDAERVAPGNAGLVEAAVVVIHLRLYPGIQARCGPLGHIVHALVLAVGGVIVGGVAAISGIIGKVDDFGTPG